MRVSTVIPRSPILFFFKKKKSRKGKSQGTVGVHKYDLAWPDLLGENGDEKKKVKLLIGETSY